MVAVGNGSSVGGGAELTPEADARGRPRRRDDLPRRSGPLARLLYAARLGFAHATTSATTSTYLRGTPVSVSGGPFWCSADGEIYGPERQRTWHVEPAAYSMCCPGRLSLRASRGGPPRPRPGSGSRRRARSAASATRRRTVRRLMPSVRAICSSWAPAASCWSRNRRRSGRGLAAVQLGHRRGPLPHQLEPAASAPRPARAGGPASAARRRSRAARAAPRGWSPMTNSRVGSSGSTRICSPTSARAAQRRPARRAGRAPGRSPATGGPTRSTSRDHLDHPRPRAGCATGRGAARAGRPCSARTSDGDQRRPAGRRR